MLMYEASYPCTAVRIVLASLLKHLQQFCNLQTVEWANVTLNNANSFTIRSRPNVDAIPSQVVWIEANDKALNFSNNGKVEVVSAYTWINPADLKLSVTIKIGAQTWYQCFGFRRCIG